MDYEVGYCLIPRWIMEKRNLSSTEKILIGRIFSLTHNEKGYCFASNAHLAEELDLSIRTVQRYLKNLEDKEYIERHSKGGDPYAVRKITPGRQFRHTPHDKSDVGGGDKSDTRSNRRVKKESIGTEVKENTKESYADQVEDVFQEWARIRKDKLGNTSGPEVALTDRRARKIRARLNEGYTPEQLKKAILGCFANEYNVENGYFGIDLIFRNSDKTDQYLAWFETKHLRNQKEKRNLNRESTSDEPESFAFEYGELD